MLKKFLMAVVILGFILFSLTPVALAVESPNIDIKGEACILVDGISGQVLYEQNPDKKWYPASITKIMTMVLALESVTDGKASFDDVVETSEYAAGMGGSQVYLYPGETRTLDEMLIAIAVGSGNDASVAVGEYLAGSNDAFVELMNKKAKEVGMKNTHFANCHGLHDTNHYTTAEDMAKLALYALKVPKFLDYTSIYEYDFRPEPKPLKLWNTNRLLKWYDGTDGMKTGYTPEAKRNLVGTAERNGLRLISVVLGVEAAKGHFTETMKLMNYGFNRYEFSGLHKCGDKIGIVKIGKGVKDSIDALAGENVGLVKMKGEEIKLDTRIEYMKNLCAPVKKGDKVGEIIVLKEGQEVDRADLVASEDVGKCGFIRQFLRMLRTVLMSF